MKNFMLLFGAATALTFVVNAPVLADDHDHAEERVDHYEAQAIESGEQALSVLKDVTAQVLEILPKDEEPDTLQFEEIHEVSYTLEAAIDKIRAEKTLPEDQVDHIDEAVQAVHFSSEKHEEDKLREWVAKLDAAVNAEAVKDADAKPVKKDSYTIVIKDHKFSPEELVVPAGERIKLIVDNQDATPEEFESHDMNREKIIGGNKKATIFVGPLKPGKYHYFGEFNMDSANGYIIAK